MRAASLLALLVLVPAAAAAPEQVHLGLRDPDALGGYAVSWIETDPAGPDFLTFHGADGDARIDARVVPGPSAGLVYEARLPPLAPGEAVSYSIGARDFPLRVPEDASAFTFVALGDMGVTRAAGNAVALLQNDTPDLVLHLGDVSYAGGDPVIWKSWFDLVEPVASRVPWVPALGNHEGDVQGIATDDRAMIDPVEQAFFTQRFPYTRDTFWYSFDFGGVHFVALDTFSQVTMPAEESAWLDADLAAAKDARWVVVFLHEPPYSSNAAHGSSPRAHGAFAQILESHGVDLVLTGHDHSYERSYAMKDGAVASRSSEITQGNGTVYIVTGGAGAPLYKEFIEPQPEWSAARKALHHVLQVNVTDTRLEIQVLPTDGSDYRDAFTITRPVAAEIQTAGQIPGAPFALVALILAIVALARRR